MRKLFLIGIGSGDPEHLTIAAINALKKSQVFFAFGKGEEKGELVRIRKDICARYMEASDYRFVELESPQRDADAPSYLAGVRDWHAARAALLRAALTAELDDDGAGAILVWGDPALYDSTLRVVQQAASNADFELDYEIIPGISSIQVLAAQHRIPLTTLGEPVLITTGRRLAEGLPANANNVVVMLDCGVGLRAIAHEDVDIYWGAYLGTPHEVCMSGRLPDIIASIENARSRLKSQHGWIMDTYLLRRRGTD